MATAQLKVIDENVDCKGDYVDIDGTLKVTGVATLAGGITLGSPTFATYGAAWANTAATPTFVSGQTYITITCNATVFRIPVFANA